MKSITRRGLFLFLLIAFLSITLPLLADGEHDLTVEKAVENIVRELNLKSSKEIKPDKVPDELLEALGEALMNEMHPDEREHLLMDNMMGGEGSDSLKAMHRAMGYRYLKGNWHGNRTMWGDFGEGCGFSFPFRGHMMSGWTGGIFMFIFFILFGGVVAYLLYLAITKSKAASTGGEGKESAIELLKKRYASGEVSKEEYDKIKKDII